MYSKSDGKGGKHGFIASTTALGETSYVAVQAFRQLVGTVYSSVACDALQRPTFLRIPRTHIILSFASYSTAIRLQELVPGEVELVTLCNKTAEIIAVSQAYSDGVAGAVQRLCRVLKEKVPATIAQEPAEESERSENESECEPDVV